MQNVMFVTKMAIYLVNVPRTSVDYTLMEEVVPFVNKSIIMPRTVL